MDAQMNAALRPVSPLKNPWTATLKELVYSVDQDLMLVSPYIKSFAVESVIEQIERKGIKASVSVRLITDIRPESALAGSLDLDAVVALGRNIPNFQLTYLPSVHAKVYVADRSFAIVTSGNLTASGLQGNVEYGVAIRDDVLVREIRSDCDDFVFLGSQVSVSDVSSLAEETRELKRLFQRAQNSIKRDVRSAFEHKLRTAQTQLYKYRARGKSTNGILADTIRMILRKGPLRTEDMHGLIQTIHPDLCDDSIDRIIGDVHFGKRWKHYVRNAQQFLKKRGEIVYADKRWILVTGEDG